MFDRWPANSNWSSITLPEFQHNLIDAMWQKIVVKGIPYFKVRSRLIEGGFIQLIDIHEKVLNPCPSNKSWSWSLLKMKESLSQMNAVLLMS